MNKKLFIKSLMVLSFIIASISSVSAAPCGNTSRGFNAWLTDFKKQARSRGISQRTINTTLRNVRYSRKVIGLDRNQRSFHLSFNQFWKLRVNRALINKGKRKRKQYGRVLNRIQKRFGVQPEILLAIWGLETSYGGYLGRPMPIFTSLATLSYDCRRSAFFKKNLFAALKIVQRGDMPASQMRGAWAGEIGQTQFMADSYVKYAVDFDGNGRRDLIHSPADVLASTANYLRAHGWRRGASYAQGTHNYAVLNKWNRATVYKKTISKMAAMIKH